MKRIFLTCLTIISFGLPSFAYATNDEAATKLKTAFQEILDYQKTIHETFGDIELNYDGELTVTKEPTFYTITFPRILISEPETNEGQKTKEIFDIGVITINAMADEKPGYWKTVMTLPNELKLGPEDGKEFVVSFSEQRNIGLFNEKLGHFTKMDMNISDIQFAEAGENTGVSLGGVQLYTNMDENTDGKFSGPGHVTISNLVIAPPEEEGTVKLGEFKVDFGIQNAVLPTLQEYKEKFLKHGETFKALENIDADDKEATAASGQAFIDMLYDMYDFELDGFSFSYSGKNIVAESNDPNKSFSLGSAKMGFGFDGIASEKGNLHIDANYKDIKSPALDESANKAIPQTGKLDLKAINIPYTSLSQIFSSTASAIAKDPDSAQMAAIGVMMRLPAVLGQAETKIMLENNGVKNEIYDLNLNGEIFTDLTSMIGFAAKFNAIFEGMDELISVLDTNLAEGEKENNKITGTVDMLKKWQAIGKQTSGPNGKAAYAFDIETTPTGQLLVNDQDISEVLK